MEVSTFRIEVALFVEFITGILTVYLGKINPLYALISIVIGSSMASYVIGIFDAD